MTGGIQCGLEPMTRRLPWLAALPFALSAVPANAAVPLIAIEDSVFHVEPVLVASAAHCCLEGQRIKGAPPLPDAESTAVIEYDFEVALVSDYRRGGISSSDGKPALQASFSASHRSGLYANLWGSNLADNGGADLELNATLGYRFRAGPLDAELGVIYYLFPGVPGTNYVELQAKLGRKLGAFTLEAAAAYTPRQTSTGGLDNITAELALEWASPRLPLTIGGTIGFENGAFGDRKIDWSLGAEYDLKIFRLGAAYVDAARTSGAPHSDGTVIFSAARAFR